MVLLIIKPVISVLLMNPLESPSSIIILLKVLSPSSLTGSGSPDSSKEHVRIKHPHEIIHDEAGLDPMLEECLPYGSNDKGPEPSTLNPQPY